MDRRHFFKAVGGLLGASATIGCRTTGDTAPGSTPLAATPGYTGEILPVEYFAPTTLAPANPQDPAVLAGPPKQVLVIGGGIAGLSAAWELAQRGYKVTVKDTAAVFGGRLHTRTENLRPGRFQVEHGLHMWFHQYFNFFDVLNRLGTLSGNFVAYDEVYYEFNDYKPELVRSNGPYPVNLLNILKDSPNLNLLNAVATIGAVKDIIFYNHDNNWKQFDNESFADWGRRTRVNKAFWDIIMEPAASVTLNDPTAISAAEMLLYMHFYFIGNPKAFRRMIAKVDHGTAVIDPWLASLRTYGATLLTNAPVNGLVLKNGRVLREVGSSTVFDHVVLATDVPGVKRVITGSQATDDQSAAALASLTAMLDGLGVAPRYHVLRVWFDRPATPRPFNQAVIETPQLRPINLLANFAMIEQQSAEWAKRTGGAVFEFHLYNTPQFGGMAPDAIWREIRSQVLRILPELADANVLDYSLGSYENFTSFAVGQGIRRPTPKTARGYGVGNLGLAGDWVALPYPCALMERAVSSGREAANAILLDDRVRQVPVAMARKNGPGLLPQF